MPRQKRTDENTLIQTSFRLSRETQEDIRDMALTKSMSHSEIMRAAVTLYRHTEKLAANLKLAVVDVEDKKDTEYFRVKKWIIEE